jgi:ribonuclease P protein component
VINLTRLSLDYARDRRIVKTDEFSSVFRLRPIQRTAHFVLYARANQLDKARLGVVVAKRLAPRAVTRNAVKRAARELFRQSALPAVDCIVRLSKPVNAKSGPAVTAGLKTALRAELTQLLSGAAPAMALAAMTAVAAVADTAAPARTS